MYDITPWKSQGIDRYRPLEISAESESGPLDLGRCWQIARSNKWIIAGSAAMGVLAAVVFTIFQVPLYRGEASLEILHLNRDFLNLKDVEPTATSSEISTATQVQLLRSSTLIRRAVERVRSKKLAAPKVGPEYPIVGRFGFRRRAADIESSIATAAANVDIQPRGDSQLVEVLTASTNPDVAAEFANALAAEYIERSLELRWASYHKTGDWLAKRIGELKDKLKRSETELLEHASRGGFTFGNEEQNPTRAKLEQLQAEYSAAQADRMAKQSRYEQTAIASATDALNAAESPSLAIGTQKLHDLRRELAELRTIFTPAHYKVKQVEAKIAAVEAGIVNDRSDLVNGLRNEYEASRRREALLQQAYESHLKFASQQASNLINYAMLKRDVETTRNLYESMLQKVNDAGTAAALRESSARIVDPASPESRPVHPRPARNVAFGVICGVFLAVVLVGFRELNDSSMKTPDEVRTALRLPELGVIPSAALNGGPVRRNLPLLSGDVKDVQLVKWRGGGGPLVESFRSVLLSLMYSSPNSDRSLVVVIASAGPGEGKTTVTVNLGAALAESGRRVLIVDADVRRPNLHRACGIDNTVGVWDILSEDKPVREYAIEEIVKETEVRNLFVLTAGKRGDRAPQFESRRPIELIAACREAFPNVLIDTPPILSFADSRIWARSSDGVVLVVRAGDTPRVAAKLAVRRVLEDATPIIGTILNDWDPAQFGGGYGRYYAPYADQESNS